MTTPYLPDDCIYNILKYFKNYHSTLFNCLLVNRFWCEATVPLLYVDPFSYLNNNTIYINKRCEKNFSVILTLISCFSKTEILQLKNLMNININDKHKPLFKYSKYLENYDYYTTSFVISLWIKTQDRFTPKTHEIETIFHQLILRQCNNNIKQLTIPMSYSDENLMAQTFKKLNSLSIVLHDGIGNPSEFLNNLANICLNLRKLAISHDSKLTSNKKLYAAEIIQKQNNLKAFKASQFTEYLLNDIFLSLEFQKNSLVYIEFEKVSFNKISFKNFITLCNLKYLKFKRCSGITSEAFETLKFASFKLRVLIFEKNTFNNNNNIIKHLGESLEELTLMESITNSIIKDISMYCLNLITLEIVGIDSNIKSFSYFKNLKIRKLILVNYNWLPKNFMNLANNLHTSVKEISIWNLRNSQQLKAFLENCHYLEIIYIYLNDLPIGFKVLDLLKVILNTKKSNNNNLEFSIMEYPNGIFNDEELKLFNQIKDKGIKIRIVPYKSCGDDSLCFTKF